MTDPTVVADDHVSAARGVAGSPVDRTKRKHVFKTMAERIRRHPVQPVVATQEHPDCVSDRAEAPHSEIRRVIPAVHNEVLKSVRMPAFINNERIETACLTTF